MASWAVDYKTRRFANCVMLREANVIRSVLLATASTVSLLLQVELLSEIRHEVKLKIFFSNQCEKKKEINDILT